MTNSKTRKIYRRRERSRISALLFGLVLAYVDEKGVAPSIRVTKRATEILETDPTSESYSNASGRRTILNALSDLADLTKPPVIELLKRPTSGQMYGIKLSKNGALADRTRKFKKLFIDHKVDKPGGISFKELATALKVEERTVRRWARGQQKVSQHLIIPLLMKLNPGAENDLESVIMLACEVFVLLDELYGIGLSDDEVWKAINTAHGSRLKRMKINRSDILIHREQDEEIKLEGKKFEQLKRRLRTSNPKTSMYRKTVEAMQQVRDRIDSLRADNKIIQSCLEQTNQLIKEYDYARSNIRAH